MKLGTAFINICSLATVVAAQSWDFNPIARPSKGEKVTAATTFTIRWTAPEKYENVTVSLSLIGGESQGTQVPLIDIASGIKNTDEKYNWKVPYTKEVIGRNFYGLKISSDENENDWQYSNPFRVVVDEQVLKNSSIALLDFSGDGGDKNGDIRDFHNDSAGATTMAMSTRAISAVIGVVAAGLWF